MKEECFSGMEHNDDLARLEQFVEKLIGSHNQLKNEKSEMLAQLQKKEQEIADLQDKLKTLQEDRSVMHNQVTGLIDRIGEWEKILDQETEAGPNNGSGEEQTQEIAKETSTLFNVGTEQSL
jgi:predicted nuclease with TOPRIM domain